MECGQPAFLDDGRMSAEAPLGISRYKTAMTNAFCSSWLDLMVVQRRHKLKGDLIVPYLQYTLPRRSRPDLALALMIAWIRQRGITRKERHGGASFTGSAFDVPKMSELSRGRAPPPLPVTIHRSMRLHRMLAHEPR